jgi:hypothetical protein
VSCKTRKKLKKSVEIFFDDFRKAPSKREFIVDSVWDSGFKIVEGVVTPAKVLMQSMGVSEKITKANWFEVTKLQKQSSEVINDFRNSKANIYDEANNLMQGLKTLGKDDNVLLVKALNGDMKAIELNKDLKVFYDKFRAVIDKNANDLVEAGILGEKQQIEHYLKRYYEDYIDNGAVTGGSVAFQKLQKRKDLTYDERIALGMVEDATFVISNTIAEQNILLQKAKVLQSLADKFGIDEAKDGYVLISNESLNKGGVKKWGALSGKYIPSEVKTELDYSRIVSNEINGLNDGLYPMIDHLKVNLTVKNPVTHIYNIASNILLSGMNGDMLAVGKVLYMRYKTPNKFKALIKKANKYGLNSQLDDFEKAHIDLAPDGKKVNVVASIWKNLYMTQDSKLGSGVRKLYDWEDKIFKLGAFQKLLDEGMNEDSAYKKAVEVYVDYSTPLPAGIRVLDKSGLMPFLHYQYKATPAVAKVMLKHPLRTVMLQTGVLLLGGSVFQNEEEEYYKPDWANNKFNLLGVKEWVRLGNGWYLNAGRMIPGTKFEFEVGGILKGIGQIGWGETPLGYNINKKDEDFGTRWGKRLLVLTENYLPSMTLGRYMQRMTKIGMGKADLIDAPQDRVSKTDDTVTKIISRSMGRRQFNEKKELKSKLQKAGKIKDKKERDAKIKEIRKASAKAKLSLGKVSTKSSSAKFDLNIRDSYFE